MTTAGRVAPFAVGLLVCAGLWGWTSHVRNDVVATTRSLVKQIRKVDALAAAETSSRDELGAADEQGMLRALERRGRSQARFFIRYHHPQGAPNDMPEFFEELWYALRDCEPETATYVKPSRGRKEPPNTRRVEVSGEDPSGEPVRVTLHWERWKNTWYIVDYRPRAPGYDLSYSPD